MAVDQEPKVKKKKLPIRGNPWKPGQVTGHIEVSSGSLPTHDEHLPLDGTGEETVVEGSEVQSEGSPTFPGTPIKVSRVQKGVDLDK